MSVSFFCDMDGVLVDFVKPALELHGKHIPPSEVRWNFPAQVGLTDSEFWPKLGRAFWATLPWTAEGAELLDFLTRNYKDRIALLSSPCATDGCCDGKRSWVNANVPRLKSKLILASCKEMFAHGNALLIDDYDGNVEKFRAAGGNAVLIPRPWNSRASECDSNGSYNLTETLWEIWVHGGGAYPE